MVGFFYINLYIIFILFIYLWILEVYTCMYMHTHMQLHAHRYSFQVNNSLYCNLIVSRHLKDRK